MDYKPCAYSHQQPRQRIEIGKGTYDEDVSDELGDLGFGGSVEGNGDT